MSTFDEFFDEFFGNKFKMALESFLIEPSNIANQNRLALASAMLAEYAGHSKNSIEPDQYLFAIYDILQAQFPEPLKLSKDKATLLSTFINDLPDDEDSNKRRAFHALNFLRSEFTSKEYLVEAEDKVQTEMMARQHAIEELGNKFKLAFESFLIDPSNVTHHDRLMLTSKTILDYVAQYPHIKTEDILRAQFPEPLELSEDKANILAPLIQVQLATLPETEQAIHPLKLMIESHVSKQFICDVEEKVRIELLLLQHAIVNLDTGTDAAKLTAIQIASHTLNTLVKQHFALPLSEQKTNAKHFYNEAKKICSDAQEVLPSNIIIILQNLLRAIGKSVVFYSTYLLTNSNDRDKFFSTSTQKQISNLSTEVSTKLQKAPTIEAEVEQSGAETEETATDGEPLGL